MPEVKLFDDIPEAELPALLECLQAKRRKFSAGSNMSARLGKTQTVGVLLSGEADLVRYDVDGYRNIVEHLEAGDVYGETTSGSGGDELAVVCEKACEVLLIEQANIFKRCSRACACHSTLVANLMQILGEKVRALRTHIEIISQRSVRNKLLTYFRIRSREANASSFSLPFTLADLAGYLYIDRSAMLREMKNMRDEGLIDSRGRKITLLTGNTQI